MRLIIILIISGLALSVNGQIGTMDKKDANVSLTTSIGNKKALVDSLPLVEYVKTDNVGSQPAYFINGVLSNPSILMTINNQLIDSVNVEKKEIEIKGKRYDGQIYLKMKKEYNPQFISLTGLKFKYTSLTNRPTLFLIDNEIIKGDYNQFLVDEKFILKIIVDTLANDKDKLNVNVIRLITKTKENIKKSKEIRIRGLDKTASD